MAGQGFDISVTSNELVVKQDGSLQSGFSRGLGGVMCILSAVFFFARLALFGRRNSPSALELLMHSPTFSSDFIFGALFTCFAVVCSGYLLLLGIRMFFPAGEELRCDRTTFTYSNIPTISLRGRWKARTFAVSAVSELMYGVIAFGDSDKGTPDVYGLNFFVGAKEFKIFAGLEAPDADRIVKQLRVFGVDVIGNQDMSVLIEKTNQDRGSMLGSF